GAYHPPLLPRVPLRLRARHRPRQRPDLRVLPLPDDLGLRVSAHSPAIHAPGRTGQPRKPILRTMDSHPGKPCARLPRSLRSQTMKRLVFLLLTLVLMSPAPLAGADAKIRVVATIPDLADMARHIGGEPVPDTSPAPRGEANPPRPDDPS